MAQNRKRFRFKIGDDCEKALTEQQIQYHIDEYLHAEDVQWANFKPGFQNPSGTPSIVGLDYERSKAVEIVDVVSQCLRERLIAALLVLLAAPASHARTRTQPLCRCFSHARTPVQLVPCTQDDDGDFDLIFTNFDGSISTYYNDGRGNFSGPVKAGAPSPPPPPGPPPPSPAPAPPIDLRHSLPQTSFADAYQACGLQP